MNRNCSVTKTIMVALALVGGVAGVAQADDSSLSRFGGDGYVYFNEARPVVSKAPRAFRLNNPNGLPESYYQSLSS